MKRIYTLLLLATISLSTQAFWSSKPAEESSGLIIPAKPTEGKIITKQPPPTTTTLMVIYCPEHFELQKHGLFWEGPSGWRSYAQSFVNEIDSFLGARWSGVNVGKMACVYKGKKAYTFPVVLQNDKLVPTPKNGKWGKLSDGKVECHSNEILDCPFEFTKQETDIKRVYEELEFFEGRPESEEEP